jgi:peptidoglycan/LPS O-acetylase OafA/YrhL
MGKAAPTPAVVCGCCLRTQQGAFYASVLFVCGFLFFVLSGFLLESLILAQDERWRRA